MHKIIFSQIFLYKINVCMYSMLFPTFIYQQKFLNQKKVYGFCGTLLQDDLN